MGEPWCWFGGNSRTLPGVCLIFLMLKAARGDVRPCQASLGFVKCLQFSFTHSPRPNSPSSQGEAFILFVERKHPQLFDHRGDAHNRQQEFQAAPSVPTSARSRDGSRGRRPRVVRSYRSKEDVWARSRRKNVPKRVLDDLLAAWRSGTERMTPAEYGAVFVGAQVTGSYVKTGLEGSSSRELRRDKGQSRAWVMDEVACATLGELGFGTSVSGKRKVFLGCAHESGGRLVEYAGRD